MPETIPQSYANHTRRDPLFLALAAPVLANVIITGLHAFRHGGFNAWWSVIMSVVLVVMLVMVRTYPLKVQDRVIRLEERLRISALAPELKTRLSEISERQLVALRFASDAELPALTRRALDEKLEPKQIKEAIKTWRPDHWRV